MALRESFQYSYSFFKSTKVVNKKHDLRISREKVP